MAVSATSAGGLPAFVVDGNGPVRVALAFRVGTSDERLVEAGVTHLVEHLAMHALGRTAHDSNAFVDPLRTVFYATGTVEEVTAFLKAVCAGLQALPLDRLELERRVLLTEAARRGGSASDELLAYRFGPRTYGVRAYAEHGLRRLQADDVRAWTAARFTSGNGALWSTVPLNGLELDLPPGPRLDAVEPHTVDRLPARFGARAALGLDVVAPRSAALARGWRVLQHRVHDALRREHAVVYDVAVESERVGRDSRRLVLLTDPLPEVRYRAGRLLARALEQLAQEGVTDEEVRAETGLTLRAWDEPGADLAAADAAVLDALLGLPFNDLERHRDEQAALLADDVTAALREALGTALVAVPDEVVTVLPLTPVARWSATWEPGRAFWPDPRVAQASVAAARRRLVVGEGGVTLAVSEREPVTVPYQFCEAVLAWEDGSRRLFCADGFSVSVLPWEWHDGAGAVALIDRAAPAEIVVPMGAGEGPPPELAAPVTAPAAAPVAPKRGWALWALFPVWVLVLVAMTTLAFTPVDVSGRSDLGPYIAYGCDRGSALEVLREGPGPQVLALPPPGDRQLGDACRNEARIEVGLAVTGVMSLVTTFVMTGRGLLRVLRNRRARRRGATQVPTPTG